MCNSHDGGISFLTHFFLHLENLKCEFGGMVSTSNAVENEMIEIVTDAPVVWTIEINLLK